LKCPKKWTGLRLIELCDFFRNSPLSLEMPEKVDGIATLLPLPPLLPRQIPPLEMPEKVDGIATKSL